MLEPVKDGQPVDVTSPLWTRVPLEALLVVSLVAILFGIAFLSSFFWLDLLRYGLAVSVVCALVGLPLEAVYFASMIVFARRDGDWPGGWIWRSFEHHERLSTKQRWLALPFFFFGAVAFGLASLATLVTVFALFLGYHSDWKPG